MRRFIAYLIMSIAILTGIGLSFVPVISLLSSDMTYSNGYQVTYQLNDWEDASSDLASDQNAAKEIAEEMTRRLEIYDVDAYEVKALGNDMVEVSFATIPNATVRANIEQYLGFSGGDFSLATENEETRLSQDQIFEGSEAYIVYEGYVPYVIIPVSDPSRVNTLLETFNQEGGNEDESAEESTEEEEVTPDVYLWANWVEGDDYTKAQEDQETANKIIASFNHENIWYPNSDEPETELMYLCGYADEEGNYDVTRIEEANNLAIRVTNFFNASRYEYEVTLLYEEAIPATVDNLINSGAERTVALSLTLVATLVAYIIVSIILFAFYRLMAFGMISSHALTVFLTMVVFISLGSTFNVGALVAIATIYIASILLTIIYGQRFKEEVYKGRMIKKAHQEAAKKMTMPTIDISVALAVLGLLTYFLGGNALMSAGVILFFGAIFFLLINLIIYKIMMYLLANANNVQNKYNYFYIDEKLVPDLTKDEKSEYKAPFSERNFHKRSKAIAIVSGVLMLASIAGITTFGVLNNGNIYNSSTYNATETQVFVTISSETIPTPSTSDLASFEENVLPRVLVNGEAIEYLETKHNERTYDDYDLQITIEYDYFVTTLSGTYGDDLTYAYLDENDAMVEVMTLEEAFNGAMSVSEGVIEEYATARLVEPTIPGPNNGYIALACAITIVAMTIYYALRYRTSEALATLTITAGSVLITIGFFTLTRIVTMPTTGIAMLLVTIVGLLMSMLIMNKDKELRVDAHKTLTLADREYFVKDATSKVASTLLIFAALAAFVTISFFGFGPFDFAIIFGAGLLGIILMTILALTLFAPISNVYEKMTNKMLTYMPKRQKVRKIKAKKTTSEPEETTFIGIND